MPELSGMQINIEVGDFVGKPNNGYYIMQYQEIEDVIEIRRLNDILSNHLSKALPYADTRII
jgi:hypothetical protein